MSIGDIRRDYARQGLAIGDLDRDPIGQFQIWFQEALDANVPDANAMTLATATADGIPSARIVLLKGVDERGFRFFTNYGSQKARELDANPCAALVFYWYLLERQVCVRGRATKLSREESETYFKSRPFGSRVGAWASPQDTVISDRETLEQRFRELEERYANGDVPLPDYWGGYTLAPQVIEFWQGRPNRLHDRFRYSIRDEGAWEIERLAP